MSGVFDDLDRLTAATTSAGKPLGVVVWWNQSGSEIGCETFRVLWEQAGLSPDLLPPRPPAARALRDAGHSVLKGHGNKRQDFLLRPAGEENGVHTYALVAEENPVTGLLKHGQVATFRVQPSGYLSDMVEHIPDHASQALVLSKVAQIKAAYARIHGTYQPRDIRECIMRALRDAAAVPLREHGGVYWVPEKNAEVARHLKWVVEKLGDSAFYILPIHSSREGDESVGRAARASLEEELNELQKELNAWAVDAASGGGPRPTTVEARIEALVNLNDRAELYQDILNLKLQDIQDGIARTQLVAGRILALGDQ